MMCRYRPWSHRMGNYGQMMSINWYILHTVESLVFVVAFFHGFIPSVNYET